MTVDFKRLFAMSTFEALRVVRLRQRAAAGRPFAEIVELIQTVEADGTAHDFLGASELDPIVPVNAPSDEALVFYRHCIEAAILQHRPLWQRTLPYGRKSFVQKLEQDEAQCFEAAGLMIDPIDEAVRSWWDRLAGLTRLAGEAEKMERARDAERRTLAYEVERLARLGIERRPVWMSIEDNWAGYDVLSFDRGPDGPITRLVEVKSTIASPLRFFVTRNEWEKCTQVGPAYCFHIWDLKTGNLFEKYATDIAPHVPADNGDGRWSNVEIRVSGLASANSCSAMRFSPRRPLY